ncbi:hypothetical protein BC936DRAFT_137767 [Jimgerdemannia flammicorona]|uniref:Glycosyl transferase family 1 domain-containing protein n=1 Tax=Jimgerdemannia flammicorona TaxID=994334 RepID=A0A433CWQ3_9FUNG|nr:hypothetical protein BC936DRAFT_137767 [Jimgerdemannia flammicorona]RUP43020.1 hypothetical protein BC936DRAFT_137767 [Jimgerdemannia flammicorona]
MSICRMRTKPSSKRGQPTMSSGTGVTPTDHFATRMSSSSTIHRVGFPLWCFSAELVFLLYYYYLFDMLIIWHCYILLFTHHILFPVTGLIPHIKRLARSNTKLIYRSHIEIRADLIRESPEGPQATTWGYLWNSFVRHADLFVSHPVTNFIPDDLPRDRVVLMPATTDPLDGLNKEMAERDMTYYRLVFNRVCSDQGSKSVNWDRPYIVQIARFDPSKGIGDVLKSYKILREKIASVGNFSEIDIPQLVVCGHGSMDDPDGTIIYEQTYLHVQSDQFADINADIIIARVPPCDQLLNMILRGAYVALQLSHREGFEVKVTEALAKGVPVIAYQAGGIPLQIQHGRTGYLVPVGDTSNVASLLFELFSNGELRERMSIAAKETPTEEYWTVVNAINWLFLSNTLAAEGSEDCKPRVRIGDGKWVKEFWRDGANYSGPQPTTN